MYRRYPARQAQDKWHRFLDNGCRFVLVDDAGKVYAAHHDRYPLEHQQRLRPTLILRIVLIATYITPP